MLRKSWQPHITISSNNLVANAQTLIDNGNDPNQIIAVLKDNAYGCGSINAAKVFSSLDINRFAVAKISEAKELRNEEINGSILVLGECTHNEILWAAQNNVSIAVNSMDSFNRIVATSLNPALHINIDTGMHRLGILPKEIIKFIDINRNHDTNIEGIFTHFASADIIGTQTVCRQLATFDDCLNLFMDANVSFKTIHVANSAAILRHNIPKKYAIRTGIILYGCNPDPVQDFGMALKPCMTLYAPVVRIQRINSHESLGYGGKFHSDKATRIATIAIGYSHGIPRSLSNKGFVLIGNGRYPICGSVTMDYIMVDIGMKDSIHVGDEAVIIGRLNKNEITPDHIAKLCGTIGYEILCGISQSIERIILPV